MKYLFVAIFLINSICYGQSDSRVSTIDFVEILQNNKAEALYYYENNWKVLREMAIAENYIESYQLLETPYSKEAPFHLMLITTYANQKQYNLREENFNKLIEQLGGLKLLNDQKPPAFRKSVFVKENVKHLTN